MYTKEQLKLLPKIEVSFQDDFSDSERQFTITTGYILSQLENMNIVVKIGDEILLFEKDINAEDREYYLCNVGKISEAPDNFISEFPGKEFKEIDGKAIIINVDSEYFNLEFNDSIMHV